MNPTLVPAVILIVGSTNMETLSSTVPITGRVLER
jgi:hypothetical protein